MLTEQQIASLAVMIAVFVFVVIAEIVEFDCYVLYYTRDGWEANWASFIVCTVNNLIQLGLAVFQFIYYMIYF